MVWKIITFTKREREFPISIDRKNVKRWGRIERMSSKENEKSEDVRNIREAVKNIKTSSHILVTAGAGFSADSGLPVYKDIAKVEGLRKDERRLRGFVRNAMDS